MHGDQLVGTLYERYQARDWIAAAALLYPEARLHMPATDEHLVGREQVIALQRNYPEPWGELRVLRVVSDSAVAVAEVEIVSDAALFRCAGFWTIQEDMLRNGVEYWVTVGGEEPPADRAVTAD
jgi:SnoaL-like domain